MKTTAELIALLERLRPGLENSSSSAEDAMIRVLPEVIAALCRAANLEAALQEIADRHIPDQPMAYDVPHRLRRAAHCERVDYIAMQYGALRALARTALEGGAA